MGRLKRQMSRTGPEEGEIGRKASYKQLRYRAWLGCNNWAHYVKMRWYGNGKMARGALLDWPQGCPRMTVFRVHIVTAMIVLGVRVSG